MLAMNAFSLCVCGNVFTFIFWRNIWWIIEFLVNSFFSTLYISFHCFLCSIVLHGNQLLIILLLPCTYESFFSCWFFCFCLLNICYICLVWISLYLFYSWFVELLGYIFNIVHQILKDLSHCFFHYFFCPFLFLFLGLPLYIWWHISSCPTGL